MSALLIFSLFFFAVGALSLLVLAELSSDWKAVKRNAGLFVLSSFAISVGVNVALSYGLSYFSMAFSNARAIIITLSLLLLSLWIVIRIAGKASSNSTMRSLRLTKAEYVFIGFLCGFLFIIYNSGAAIDSVTDAWWHMAVINKMVLGNTTLPNVHPLTGPSGYYDSSIYPPFWHLNLALLASNSTLSIPSIWNHANVLVNGLTVVSYFLLASAVTQSKNVAVLAAILFVLLIGGLNTYHRVMVWPSNVSFLLSYVILYFVFDVLRFSGMTKGKSWLASLISYITQNKAAVSLLALFCALTVGIHPAAIFWIAWSLLVYIAFVWFSPSVSPNEHSDFRQADQWTSRPVIIVLLFGYIVYCLVQFHSANYTIGKFILYGLPLLGIVYAKLSEWLTGYFLAPRFHQLGFFCLILIGAALLVDPNHLAELIWPNPKSFAHYYFHVPQQVGDLIGTPLILPAWEHQLRSSLLPTGLIAIALSVYLTFAMPGRGNTYLCANALGALFIISSPYFFTWLASFIPDESVYRVHLLIFAPMIFAVFIQHLWAIIRPRQRSEAIDHVVIDHVV